MVLIFILPMWMNFLLRTFAWLTLLEKTGVIKVVFAADSDVLLGAQMLCPRATDMIGELATAVANGLTSRQLMYAMRAHPTFNEAIASAVEDSRGKSVTW